MSAPISDELCEFHHFLGAKLKDGAKSCSPEEALDEWRALHPDTQAIDDEIQAVQEALADLDAGDHGVPFDEFDRAFRKQHRIPDVR